MTILGFRCCFGYKQIPTHMWWRNRMTSSPHVLSNIYVIAQTWLLNMDLAFPGKHNLSRLTVLVIVYVRTPIQYRSSIMYYMHTVHDIWPNCSTTRSQKPWPISKLGHWYESIFSDLLNCDFVKIIFLFQLVAIFSSKWRNSVNSHLCNGITWNRPTSRKSISGCTSLGFRP